MKLTLGPAFGGSRIGGVNYKLFLHVEVNQGRCRGEQLL